MTTSEVSAEVCADSRVRVTQTGITELLIAWRRGDDRALGALMPAVYEELRRVARRHLRRERPDHTLQPTALVNELYLRLVDANRIEWRDRIHFFAIASRIMRQVLVDAARAKGARKRGGSARRVTLTDVPAVQADQGVELVRLDGLLDSLAHVDVRKARVVELRVFGGLSVQDIAAALNVSTDTVGRDWSFAKSWLKRELRKAT